MTRKAATFGQALFLSMLASAACAGERLRPDAACPAYDLHITTLIEDHGIIGDTDHEVLREAALRVIDARLACRSGDVTGALEIYDSINLDGVRMSSFYRVSMR
jgi:hypothetical protein